MANTDPNEWRLIDADLVTEQGIFPAGQRHLYFELNEPGSGQLNIPLGSNIAASVASGMFSRGSYRGAVRGGFFIENINKIHVDAREGAGKVLSISGRGAMALLDDAMVWDDGTNASTREFVAITKAAMLIAMINEAQARGALANLTYDFTAVLDSDGLAWADSETLKFAVGMSLLDVARQFAKLGIDFDVTPNVGGTFLLSAYKLGKGTDKSETIYFRVGVNCEEVSSDERGDGIRNALRVAYRDGFISVSDAISIAARRRREKLLDVKAAQTSASALTIGAAEVELSKDPKKSISVKIYDGVGPRAFVDYGLGDTITLDVEGVETAYRIRGIQPSWDGDNYADVVVDLNSTIFENDIRMAQDIGWLMDQWETAHDMGLLETSFWAGIGDPSISYNITALHFVGTKLFVVSTGGNFYSYETTTGVWTAILPAGSASALCLTSIGTDVYFGAFRVVYKYDSVGNVLTNIGVISGGGGAEAVYAITAIGTTIYIAGDFSDVDGVAAIQRAEYNTLTDTWTAMVGGVAFTGGQALLGIGSTLYSGGNGTVQKWVAGAWSDVGTFPGAGFINAFAALGTSLLVGANNIYIWDGATWAVYGGGVNGSVRGIAVYLTDVYIVGGFTDVGNYIAKYSGGAWNTLEGGLNATGTDIALLDQDVYVGGTFTEVGLDAKPALKLAAYFTNFDSLLEYLENSGMFNLAEEIHNAPASALSDADEVPFWEDVSKAVRKITWANIKVALNALYVSLTQTANRILVSDGTGAVTTDPTLAFDSTYKNLQIGVPTITSSVYGISQGNDGASVSNILETNGTGVASFITGVRGRGTHLAQTAVQADDLIFRIRGRTIDNPNNLANTSVEMLLVANETHSPTAHGTRIEFWATPVGSVTNALALTIYGGGAATLAGALTLPASGLIMGGGILNLGVTATKALTLTATDNYNITFPATLTVAGLAIANVFIAQQTITPSSDVVGLIINKSTTANAFQVKSGVTVLASVNSSGDVLANGGSAFVTLGGLPSDRTYAGLWLAQVSPDTTNYILLAKPATGTFINTDSSTNGINLMVVNSLRARLTEDSFTLSGNAFMAMIINASTDGILQNKTGDFYFRSSGSGKYFFQTAANTTKMWLLDGGDVGIGISPSVRLHVQNTTTTTNAVLEVQRIQAVVSTAATGGGTGFGAGIGLYAETATDGTDQQQAQIQASWIDATNASRKAKLSLSAYDTSARLGMEIEASGSVAKLGFFGGTTAIQQVLAAYTSDGEGAAYTGIDNLQAGTPYATVADLNQLRVAYETLRASYDDLRTKLQTSTLVA